MSPTILLQSSSKLLFMISQPTELKNSKVLMRCCTSGTNTKFIPNSLNVFIGSNSWCFKHRFQITLKNHFESSTMSTFLSIFIITGSPAFTFTTSLNAALVKHKSTLPHMCILSSAISSSSGASFWNASDAHPTSNSGCCKSLILFKISLHFP
eukprot:NODE_349_length_10402_cov_0.251286.p8 type:complete len:153 gc:universal NODE_349_length_10402_cov_0.251286:8310-8768(+)